MNVPENIAKLFRDRIIIGDAAANGDTAKRRMTAAAGQLTKAQAFLTKKEWEAAAIFAESALMVGFEAYLMGTKLKVVTTGGSHMAMAAITSYLARRAAVSIEPYQLNEVIEARAAILYHPWDISANEELASEAVSTTRRALEVLRVFPPLG
jgi:5-keto 4-deoxyuronate isomerase